MNQNLLETMAMKEKITANIGDPEALEELYRENKLLFAHDFAEIAPGYDSELVKFWQIRLKNEASTRGKPLLDSNFTVAVIISLIIALLARLPLILVNRTEEDFYFRNLPTIIMAGLTAWFIFKNRLTGLNNILRLALPVVILSVFMNFLPVKLSDTIKLAFIHAPLFLWFVLGLAYTSFEYKNTHRISDFIRYNGELAIMTGLLLIAGGILSGLTISLFAVIEMKISRFYTENIVIIGVAVSPVVAAWLIDRYPDITSKIAPVIARIFTPLVFVSAVIYLFAISISGISLSENRDFLFIFNLLLLGVMAIIVFSVSELDKSNVRKLNVIILFLLTAMTLIIDVIALAAIISRLSEGFTPNRTAVLVSNILILVNLVLILPQMFLAGFRGNTLDRVQKIICNYLPVYLLYIITVIFIFPFIFGMK